MQVPIVRVPGPGLPLPCCVNNPARVTARARVVHCIQRAARLAAGLITGLALGLLAGCDSGEPAPLKVANGDAKLGQRLLAQYQCGSCHLIPDVPAARSLTGPALDTFGRRSYIAGHIPNRPDALVAWIVDPPAMKPGTLMPAMGVSTDEARHMAAYLYSLR